jgi:hypothetical protein
MRSRPFAYGVVLVLGIVRPAVAQGNAAQQTPARQQLQQIHLPQSTRNSLTSREIWS